MNPTTGSTSTTTSSATYAAQTSFAAAPARQVSPEVEFRLALRHVRHGPRYRPVGDNRYRLSSTLSPCVAPSSEAYRSTTLTSPGTSPYHIRCFAFQTLCDIARETREIASLAQSAGETAGEDFVSCATLGSNLEDRMRNIYGISDFSISAFSRETGLVSLCAGPDPRLRVGSLEAYAYDIHTFIINAGLVYRSERPKLRVDGSRITVFGSNLLTRPDGVPVIDTIGAFHGHLCKGRPEPSLSNIWGHIHRNLCEQYSAILAQRGASLSSSR